MGRKQNLTLRLEPWNCFLLQIMSRVSGLSLVEYILSQCFIEDQIGMVTGTGNLSRKLQPTLGPSVLPPLVTCTMVSCCVGLCGKMCFISSLPPGFLEFIDLYFTLFMQASFGSVGACGGSGMQYGHLCGV